MTTTTLTTEDINREIIRELDQVGLTWDELNARKDAAVLTPEEWEAWDRVDNLRYLLGG